MENGFTNAWFLYVDDLSDACVFALEKWISLSNDAPNDDEGKPLAFLKGEWEWI